MALDFMQTINVEIQRLAYKDEQERVQKKTFTNWINSYLVNHEPPYKCTELFEDIKTGVLLLDLLEVLSNEPLPKEQARHLKRVHHLNNIRRALDFLESKKIKLVNINPSDIADGKPSIVLGLVWTVILYFQIEEQAELMSEQLAAMAGDEKGSAMQRFKMSAKKALLVWAEKSITDKTGLPIENFGKDWRDGVAFSALVHNVRPDLMDMSLLKNRSNRENLENAFSTAELHLGIPRLLDPEDVDVEKPDEKSIMTYVAQFMKSFPDPDAEAKKDPVAAMMAVLQAYQLGQNVDPEKAREAEKFLLQHLNTWLDNTDDTLNTRLNSPITDRNAEYKDLTQLMKDAEKYRDIQQKLTQLYESGKSQIMTNPEVIALKAHWNQTEDDIKAWQSKLDKSLPGRLGKVVNWLLDAEELVYGELIPAGATEAEIAAALKAKLDEHKDLFKDAEAMRKALAQMKQQGKIDGQEIPKEQMEDLSKRLNKVVLVAPHVEKKLEYEEVKHRLASLLDSVDSKLDVYGGRHGGPEEVDGLSRDYKKNVADKNLMDTIEKTLAEYKKASNIYKTQVLDPKDNDECDKIDRAIDGATARWRNQSPDLRSAGAMLDKVRANWGQYDNKMAEVEQYLKKAEAMMSAAPEERKKFFQDQGKWAELQKAVNEHGEFLVGASDEPTAAEIRSSLKNMNKRFRDLGEVIQQKEQLEVVEGARSDYKLGVGKIGDWLNHVEGLLERETACYSRPVNELFMDLEAANHQMDEVQNEFKTLSKTGQSLVKDSTQEAVSEMLGTLKVMKERLIKVKKEIPERMTKLKALAPQVEGVEAGIADVAQWLDKAEDMLDGNIVDGNMKNTAGELEKHQALFAETAYYKNMLDSKNKAFLKLSAVKSRVNNVDYDVLENQLKALSDRFKQCSYRGDHWRRVFESSLALYDRFTHQAALCHRLLDRAEISFHEDDGDISDLLRQHHGIMSRLTSALLQSAVQPGHDLLQLTQRDTGAEIKENLDNLLVRWQSVEFNAPIRQMKLEFAEPEVVFITQVEKAEKLLSDQQGRVDRREDLLPVLHKHKEVFQHGNLVPTCEKCLSDMKIICDSLERYHPDDKTLQESYAQHKQTWSDTRRNIDLMYAYLKTMPEKWKVYEKRFSDLENWMDTAEAAIVELNQETDSKNTYQKKSDEFKKLVNDIDAKRSEVTWLVDCLDDMLQEYTPSESKPHQDKLDTVVARYTQLMPKIEDADSLAATKLEGYDYKLSVDKKTAALAELMKGQEGEMWKVDDLDKLKKALKQQERLLGKLDEQKASIESSINTGKRLQDQEGCATFLPQSVLELERQWASSVSLAQENHDKLKDNLLKYEDYEGAKNKVLEFLRSAESECTRSGSPGAAQDSILKQLRAKEEYLERLRELEPVIEEMEALNNELRPDMSSQGQSRLTSDLDALTSRLNTVSTSLNDAADALDEKSSKWDELNKNLEELDASMNDLDEKLTKVQDPRLSPEEQLKLAQELAAAIAKKLPELLESERLGSDLTENYKTRESAALKSKLANLRKHHDALTNKAQSKNATLSSDATHYQAFQNSLEELAPWMADTEAFLSAEVPQCASAEEADKLFAEQQDFLKEREQFTALFDMMNSEGGQVANNPAIAAELQKLCRKWNNLMMQSDERSMKVAKAHAQWTQYEKDKAKVAALVDNLEERLLDEPDLTSSSVEALSQQLAKYKALQDDLKAQQPVYASLTQSYQQLRPNISAEGQDQAEKDAESLEKSWADISEATAARIAALQATINQRKQLYTKIDDLGKWSAEVTKRVNDPQTIFADEVGDNQTKMKKLRAEVGDRAHEYKQTINQIQELLQTCPPEERQALEKKLAELEDSYAALQSSMDDREHLCHKFAEYHDARTAAEAKLEQLQKKLKSPALTPKELEEVKRELGAVQSELARCAQTSEALDAMMGKTGLLIKERSEDGGSEGSTAKVHEVMFKANRVLDAMVQKQSHMEQVDAMMADLRKRTTHLGDWAKDTDERLDSARLEGTSADAVDDLGRKVEGIEKEAQAKKAEYVALKELARRIEVEDPTKAAEIRAMLAAMDDKWGHLLQDIDKKFDQVDSVKALFANVEEAGQSLADSLDQLEPLLTADVSHSDAAAVEGDLARHEAAQKKLAQNKSLMATFRDKCRELMAEGKLLDGFDPDQIDQAQESLESRFLEAEQKMHENKEALNQQKKLWQEINLVKGDLVSRLEGSLRSLASSTGDISNPADLQQRLNAIREEIPQYKKMAQNLRDKIAELEAMGCYEAAAPLRKMLAELEDKIASAEAMAESLEKQLAQYHARRNSIEEEMDTLAESIQQARDELAKCDDLTGTDKEIAKRLERARVAKEQIAKDQSRMEALKGQLDGLTAQFGVSAETQALATEGDALAKKVDNAAIRAEKVEGSLEEALQQQHQEALQDQQRWTNAARDRLAWCQDTSGDKYSVEAKLATIQELLNSLPEGEAKTALLSDKSKLLLSLLPPERRHQIQEQMMSSQDGISVLRDALRETKAKLEQAACDWRDYNQASDNLSHWLRDVEATIRAESNLKPDLASKKQQLEKFKELSRDLAGHKPQVDMLVAESGQIADKSGDARVVAHAGQVNARYNTAQESVKDWLEKFEQGAEDHENYCGKQKSFGDWLKSAQSKLDQCNQLGTDKADVMKKQDIIKDLMKVKDIGSSKFNDTIEFGEKLYPSTASEGREIVRQELRNLRDQWERFSEEVNHAQRDVDNSAGQWLSFDDYHDELQRWMLEAEASQRAGPELKNTLQEKKSVQQQYKNRYHDILSHEAALDAVCDKAQCISTPSIMQKVNDMKSRYQKVTEQAKENQRISDDHVDQHQAYTDSYQQARDWLQAMQDKLQTKRDPGADKQAVQNKLDHIQLYDVHWDLLAAREEGQRKIAEAVECGRRTMAQTAPAGKSAIKRELEALGADEEKFIQRAEQLKAEFENMLSSLQAYDDKYEELGHWVREMEAQLRDYDLKSTLSEKQEQVDRFQRLQAAVEGKQGEFDALTSAALELRAGESRLGTYASQIQARHQALKHTAQDVLSKWDDYVKEHAHYMETAASTESWLSGLHHQLDQCCETTPDKALMERNQALLSELTGEKEAGVSLIHRTVEAGERLFPSTAAPGRDTVRQQLRTIRDDWDSFCDRVTDGQRRLDSALHQWSSYDESQERFVKWVHDTRQKLAVDDELKATLAEKKGQLHAHKVVHQDILAHQHVVDSVCDKAQALSQVLSQTLAQALSQTTKSAQVQSVILQLNKDYQQLCETSKQLNQKYEQHVTDHQRAQDAVQECAECSNLVQEKVAGCQDTTGDQHTLQIRLDRIKTAESMRADCRQKLEHLRDVTRKILPQTSSSGCDAINRDVAKADAEIQSCFDTMDTSRARLEEVLSLWKAYNDSQEALIGWIKAMEARTRDYELRSTLEEKREQHDKFAALLNDVMAKQRDLDDFKDKANELMGVASDARIHGYVSQLTLRYDALLTTIKDLMSKWDRYVTDHVTYNENQQVISDWLREAEAKLVVCQSDGGDRTEAERRRQALTALVADKDLGAARLNAAVESGEKLYPDTAAPGREQVRQRLRAVKEDWDHLLNGINDAQRKFESYLNRLDSYGETQEQLSKWLTDTETSLKLQKDSVPNTLQDKREQLHNHRTMLQDINSHHRVVDAAIEKAQSILPNTEPKLASFVNELSSKYQKVKADAKALVQRSEERVQHHQQYQDGLQTCLDWIALNKDRAAICNDVTGDKHAVQNRKDRLLDLIRAKQEGKDKLDSCTSLATTTMSETGPVGQKAVAVEQTDLKLAWSDYETSSQQTLDRLEQCLEQWRQYDQAYDRLSAWIRDSEKSVKDFNLVSTLEDKHQQLATFQRHLANITDKQGDFDDFVDEVQSLQQCTADTRSSSQIAQLTSRYQALQVTVKEICKKCEQNVSEAEQYDDYHGDCVSWIRALRSRMTEHAQLRGSRAQLETKQDQINEMLYDKDTGLSKLSAAVESGEKLYSNTASEGREVIRQQLRALKLDWDALFDELNTGQRKLEGALVQWRTVDDSIDQLEDWMKNASLQVNTDLVLKSTLEEKKAQLQIYKTLHQEVCSYQRVLDGVGDKAQTLANQSTDTGLTNHLSQLTSRYQTLCTKAKDCVKRYEDYVRAHQQYYDAYNEARDWLATMKERLNTCNDVSGDRHAVQSRLERLQELSTSRQEGEPKIRHVTKMAEAVLLQTSEQGRAAVVHDLEGLQSDWRAYQTQLDLTKAELKKCVDQWKVFDGDCERCGNWLKETEHQLRDVQLKSTLSEKRAQFDKMNALNNAIADQQVEFDGLTEHAQAVFRIGGDAYVNSQAQQLNSRYLNLAANCKEMLKRWEQYVCDHETYDQSRDHCRDWQDDYSRQLDECADGSGNKEEMMTKLEHINDLCAMRDDGFRTVQTAADNLQVVLPNTAPSGRENLRREMQECQQNWDRTSARLNEAKSRVEGNLSQVALYDEGVVQLQRWLTEQEQGLRDQQQLQATVPDKKAQLDRAKTFQMTVNGHQSTVAHLAEKARSLQTSDRKLLNQVDALVARYQALADNAAAHMRTCDTYVQEHAEYRDVLSEASDVITSAKEKLLTCSDTRGDHQNVETKLQKVENLQARHPAIEAKMAAVADKASVVMTHSNEAGRDQIREELRAINQEWDTYMNTVLDVQTNLGRILAQWTEYEDQAAVLNDWLKNAQTTLKSNTDLKSSLNEKQEQLEAQQSQYEDIVAQQSQFDLLTEKAQSLLQNSGDAKLSSQLSQIGARYSALCALSKDHVKKAEQIVDDHQQYKESTMMCRAWLNDTKQRLAVSTRSAADKQQVQAQLDKLKDFVILREEGQGLIYSTNALADKTMANTSLPGRDIVKQELNALQRDWEELVANYSDNKIALETCFLQWTDFDDSTSQVRKWLKEMENKLSSVETKPELGDKKVALQKSKGLQQDIASYQHMIDSLAKKSRELEQKSPGVHVTDHVIDVLDKYAELKDMAEDAVKRNEKCLDDHQKYQEASVAYNNWLRSVREKLATCSDVYGDKDAVKAKMEKAKMLEEALLDGEEKLDRLQALAAQVLPGTSLQGQNRIKEELATMERGFNDFRNELEEAEKDLNGCVAKWDNFEEKKVSFQDWLTESLAKLKAKPDLQATADGKEEQLAAMREVLQDILDHQAELDDVNECAQALLETNADAKVSNAMTQMASKYQALLNAANESVKKLESQATDHACHDEAADDFQRWLEVAQSSLDQINPKAPSKQDLDNNLADIMDLQTALDEGHSKLRAACAYAERVMPNTSRDGAKRIRAEMDQNKDMYEKLKRALTAKKAELEAASAQWADVDRVHDQLDTWLTDCEAKAEKANRPGDFADKKTELERCKALLDDVVGHGMSMEKLREKSSQLEGTDLGDKILDILTRYDTLEKATQEKAKALQSQVAEQERFRKQCQNTQDLAADTRAKLGKLSDTTGDKHDIQARINKLGSFRGDMAREHARVLAELAAGAEKLMENATPEEKRAIRRDLETAKEELASLAREAELSQQNMDNCVLKLKKQQEAKARFAEWLKAAEGDLKQIKVDKPTLEEKQRAFRKAESLIDDIAARKADLDDLTELSKDVMQTSLDPQISTDMMQMSTRYQALAANAKEIGGKLEQAVKDQRAYEVAYADCAQWLESSAENLNACHNMAGDWNELEGRIDAVREINSNLDEGQEKLNKACEMAQKLLRSAAPESRKMIQSQIDKLKEAWDNLQGNINICSTNLEKSLLKYNEYEESYDLVLNWMLDVEKQLVPDPAVKSQLADKKQQLDKYKAIQTDIGYHSKQVDDLLDVATQIQAARADKQLDRSVGEMRANYDKIRKKADEICDKLQSAYDQHQNYHTSVQDAERWILQQSFKVMSHNSLPVTSLEQTKQQQEKHAALIREIAAYKSTIDGVKKKGERLLEGNKRDPVLEGQVGQEMASLNDSYQALVSTAQQIQDRLKEASDHWAEYQALVGSTEKFLDKDATLWWIGKRKPLTDSIEHAHIQLHDANEMLQKLQQLKQELASAAHQCDQGDGTETSAKSGTPAAKQANRVNAALQDNIDKIQERINGLRDGVKAWQKLDSDKATLRDWLRGQQAEVKDARDRPAKLHSPTAEREAERLKAMKALAAQKKQEIDNMVERHRDLTYHDPSLRDPVLRSLQDDYDDLLNQLDNVITANEQMNSDIGAYNGLQSGLDGVLDGMEREQVGQLHSGLKVPNFTSLADLTDTATQTPYESATQTPLSMLGRPASEAALSRRYLSPSLSSLNRPLNGSIEEEGLLRNSGDKVGLSHHFWPYKSRADSPSTQRSYGRPPSGRPLSSSMKRSDGYGSLDTGIGESPLLRSKSASPDRHLLSPLRFGAPSYDEADITAPNYGTSRLSSPEICNSPFVHEADIRTFDDYTQTVPIDNMGTQTGARKQFSSSTQQTDKGRRTPSIVMSGRGTPVMPGSKLDDIAQQVEHLKNSVDDLRGTSRSPSRQDKPSKLDDDNWSGFDSDREPVDTKDLSTQTPGHQRTQTPNHAMTQTAKKPWQKSGLGSDDDEYSRMAPTRSLSPTSRRSPFRHHMDDTDSQNSYRPLSKAATQTPYNARTQTPYQSGTQTDYVRTNDGLTQTENRNPFPSNTTQTRNGRIYPHDVIPSRGTPKGMALKSLLETIKTMSKELEEHNKARAAYDSGFSSDREKMMPDDDYDTAPYGTSNKKPWLKYVKKNKGGTLPRSWEPMKADRSFAREAPELFPVREAPERYPVRDVTLPPRSLTPVPMASRDRSPSPPRYSRPSPTPDTNPYKSPYDDDVSNSLAASKNKFSSLDSIPRVIPAYHFTPVYPTAPARAPSPRLPPQPRLPDGKLGSRSFVRDYNDSTLSPERHRTARKSDMDKSLDSARKSAEDLLYKSGKIKSGLNSELRQH